jgi:hypothetical protein
MTHQLENKFWLVSIKSFIMINYLNKFWNVIQFLVQKATTGVYKVLGDKARLHPDQIVGDPFKLAAKLETGRYAFPFVSRHKLHKLSYSLLTVTFIFHFSFVLSVLHLSVRNTKRIKSADLKLPKCYLSLWDIIRCFSRKEVRTLKQLTKGK